MPFPALDQQTGHGASRRPAPFPVAPFPPALARAPLAGCALFQALGADGATARRRPCLAHPLRALSVRAVDGHKTHILYSCPACGGRNYKPHKGGTKWGVVVPSPPPRLRRGFVLSFKCDRRRRDCAACGRRRPRRSWLTPRPTSGNERHCKKQRSTRYKNRV